MEGVLKRKKLARQERIFHAALRLFKSKGFSRTSMKDIASAADLAVGTLYNYYPSKNALLIEMNWQQTDALIAEADRYLDGVRTSRKSPPRIIKDLLRGIIAYVLEMERESLRELFSAVFQSRRLMKEGIDMDIKAMEFLQKVLRIFQDKGQIDPAVDVRDACVVLYGLIVMNLISYLYMEGERPEERVRSLHRQIDLVFRGFVKK